jgi:TRAP-type mannitol/chloroaromatic compound transport system permease small subunit
MTLLKRFSDFVDGLNERIGAVIRWLALFMILLGAFNALARYLTKFTGMSLASNAYTELQWYAFSLIFLLGAAYGFRHDVHVRVDVLFARLGRKTQAWIDITGTVLFLIPFCILMLWVSWPAVRNSWAIRETSPDPGGLARYPIKAVILVGFVLLLLQALSHIVKMIEVIRGSGEPSAAAVGDDHGHGGHL